MAYDVGNPGPGWNRLKNVTEVKPVNDNRISTNNNTDINKG